MTWSPIAFLPPQYEDSNGNPYNGAVLKAYQAGTSTVINLATDYTGTTTATSFALNSSGYPVSSGGAVIIPHVQENFKLALYPTQAAADANSGAIWTYDNIQIAASTNAAFFQSFSGDNSTTAFTLSESLGTDEKALIIFVDNGLQEQSTNGTFATDTGWTKGAGWTIGAGVATATGAISTALSQTAAHTLIQGQSYTVTYTATQSAGSVTVNVGGTAGTARSSAATFTETIICGSTQTLSFTTSGFTGTVDNVSVKPTAGKGMDVLNPSAYTVNGTALTFAAAPNTGTNNIFVYAPAQLAGSLADLAAAAAISETNAAASAAAAAASAAAYATAFSTTSSTSFTPGTGSKSFTVGASKGFAPGQFAAAISAAAPTAWMTGNVTSYSGTTLVINVTAFNGSGAHTDWNIAVVGSPGIGSVTSASVVTANGFAGTVANSTTTPAITLSTSITGILKGNGTAVSAAAAGTDYLSPSGSGAALTSLTAANISAGTAGIDISGNSATVTTINGRITQGTNITITGSGTAGSPYSIAATTAIMTALGVGSIITATHSGAVAVGGTVAAAALTPASANSTGTGDTITGTWQALMTDIGLAEVNPWQRIA